MMVTLNTHNSSFANHPHKPSTSHSPHFQAQAARPCQMAITPECATVLLVYFSDVKLVAAVITGGGRSPSSAEPHWHGGSQR
jgi:hypothetical protein